MARFLLTVRFPDGSAYTHEAPRPYAFAVAVEPRTPQTLLRDYDRRIQEYESDARGHSRRGDVRQAESALGVAASLREKAAEVARGARRDRWSVLRWAARRDLAERVAPEDRHWRDELGHRLVVLPVEAVPASE